MSQTLVESPTRSKRAGRERRQSGLPEAKHRARIPTDDKTPSRRRTDAGHSTQRQLKAGKQMRRATATGKADSLTSPRIRWRAEYLLVMFGYVTAIWLILIFGCDLITRWPMNHASVLYDVASVICGIGLAYLTWNTHKDLR